MKRKLLLLPTVLFGMAIAACEPPGIVAPSYPTAASISGPNEVVVGQTISLSVNYTPETASIKQVTWSTDNANLATINASGVLSGVAAGSVTVTASVKSGYMTFITAQHQVAVKASTPSGGDEVRVTGVSLNKGSLALKVDDTETLVATISPSNATNKGVTWSSSNTSVATVANGVVTARAVGNATITATTADGGFTASCTVTVSAKDTPVEVIPVKGVTLNKETLTLNIGDSETLIATVNPINATNKKVSWSCSNEDVAYVENGEVTAVSAGKATITVTTEDGNKTATCSVTVNEKSSGETVHVTGVSLNKNSLTLEVGGSEKLTETVIPENADVKAVKWSSNDESVAIVSSGTVSAKAAGNAIITVTTLDGNKTATCAVTVNEKPAEITLNSITLTVPEAVKSFTVGDSFSHEGVVVTAHYSDSSTKVVTSSASFTTPDLSSAGTKTVTVSYSEKGKTVSESYSVTVTSGSQPGGDTSKEGTYTLLTGDLTVGSYILIVGTDSKNASYAMSTTQNANNRAAVSVTVSSDDSINKTKSDNIVALKVEAGTKSNTFSFYDEDAKGFLYAASSSSNQLKTESEKTNNSSFTVTGGTNKTITAQGSNSRNILKLNPSGTPIFNCYGNSATGMVVPNIFVKTGGSVDPVDPIDPVDPVDPPSPTPIDGWEEATMTPGTTASACTVNGHAGVKVGTGSNTGDMTITIPSGSVSVRFYIAAWNGTSGSANLSTSPSIEGLPDSIVLSGNSGVKDSSPFTLSGSESSYLFEYNISNVISDTTLTISSTSSAKRFVIWSAMVVAKATPATGVNLPSSLEIAIGKSKTITPTYQPAGANQGLDLTWSKLSGSSKISVGEKTGVVTVDSNATTSDSAVIQAKLDSNDATATCQIIVAEEQPDRRTVLIYMCGADLESGGHTESEDVDADTQYGSAATEDIAEILKVSGQPNDVNIVLETGGAEAWASTYHIPDELSRYHVENKNLVKEPEANQPADGSMGSKDTLQDFLTWGLTEYPAQEVSLILWNHGGAMRGVCYDERHDNNSLAASEVESALAGAFAATGRTEKLSWIGYDACLMQVQDIAYKNSKYFNYMVASEESEAGTGWDYDTWVDDLYSSTKSVTQVLDAIVDGFIADTNSLYAKYHWGDSDQTLSWLDLSYMEAYKTAWENMATAISPLIGTYGRNNFKTLIKTVQSYGTSAYDNEDLEYYADYYSTSTVTYTVDDIISSWALEHVGNYYYDYGYYAYGTFDALDLMNKLSNTSAFDDASSEIDAVKTAFGNLVKKNSKGAGAGNSNGLCCFFPLYNGTDYDYKVTIYYDEEETDFTNWRSVVTTYGYWDGHN